MTIICIKCGNEKESSEFSLLRSSKNGFKKKCKLCIAEYGRQYREKNIDKEKLRSNEYYELHKDKLFENRKLNAESKREYAKEYRQINKDKIKEVRHLRYINSDKDILKVKMREYYNNRIKSDLFFRINRSVKSLIRDTFRNKGIKKNISTRKIIGCTSSEFKTYLESKFEPWMNWDNKGLYNGEPNFGWDIDHIIPSSKATTEEEIIKLNHYTNLQPLCGYMNRVIKRDN